MFFIGVMIINPILNLSKFYVRKRYVQNNYRRHLAIDIRQLMDRSGFWDSGHLKVSPLVPSWFVVVVVVFVCASCFIFIFIYLCITTNSSHHRHIPVWWSNPEKNEQNLTSKQSFLGIPTLYFFIVHFVFKYMCWQIGWTFSDIAPSMVDYIGVWQPTDQNQNCIGVKVYEIKWNKTLPMIQKNSIPTNQDKI